MRNSRERHMAFTPPPSLHLRKQVCPLLLPSRGEPKPWTRGWNDFQARMLRLTRRNPPWRASLHGPWCAMYCSVAFARQSLIAPPAGAELQSAEDEGLHQADAEAELQAATDAPPDQAESSVGWGSNRTCARLEWIKTAEVGKPIMQGSESHCFQNVPPPRHLSRLESATPPSSPESHPPQTLNGHSTEALSTPQLCWFSPSESCPPRPFLPPA